MVFAVGLNVDVAQHDDVVVALHILEGARKIIVGVFLVAGKPFLVGVDDALGRIEQTFAFGVIAGPCQQGAHCVFRLVPRGTSGVSGIGHDLAFHHGVHGRLLPSEGRGSSRGLWRSRMGFPD